jgi:O-antigen ligase
LTAVRSSSRNWRTLLAAIVFACLPTVGIYGGGSYAGLMIGLAAVILIADLFAKRQPMIDWTLAALAIPFLVLLWLGLAWSIVPQRTLAGDLQMTGLFIAGIVILGIRQSLFDGSSLIFRAALVATIVGPIVLSLDIAIGHPLLSMVTGHKNSEENYYTKLSRGLAQMAILIWPILAYAWLNGRRRLAMAAVLVFTAFMLWQVAINISGTLSFLFGAAIFGLSLILPRFVLIAATAVVSIVAIATPFVIQLTARPLMALADQIKPSARHRLEIWDYLTARALERPFSGWGWQTAQFVPVTAEEKSHYKYFWENGIPHPHDFWIQLWLETGVFGLLLGLAFTLIVLRRIGRQPQDVRPFGLAAFATAFALSLPSFNLSTDSWWCALAATGLLFALLPSARQPR